ncbi:MAG: ATP-dependent sacrificial sulfur transferase LarE [Lachnospiraceae bacterium]|nr:ATP-dependent sacrificial sulfur transferase LarE [Lachnospiraceae bacterium]
MVHKEKLEKLYSVLRGYESAAVAFSAGVDSTFLLKAARDVLKERCIALTADSPSFPEAERKAAYEFCRENGIKQIVFEPGELDNENYAANPKDRCYYCKHIIFGKMLELAKDEGISEVLEGSNADDETDYRPGMRAVSELGIKSPLKEAGLTKSEIRELSREMGLKTWDKPSFACLASRIPYGDRITREKLVMAGKAEALLFELGFTNCRVRMHGKVARIELLTSEFEKMLDPSVREKVTAGFKELGFDYTAMDLKGYRTGSLNEVL